MQALQKTYNPVVDILRIISILAVILIHTTTRHLEFVHFDLKSVQATLFLNQISRFAVPLFFLISGFVLELSFDNNYLSYFKKRISKILVPYIFWSAFYYFLIYTKHATNFFYALLDGSASYQLYFIPALLILYFLFPVIRKLTNPYLILILGIIQIYLLKSDYSLHGLNIYFPINIALLNSFIFIIGIAAHKYLHFLKFTWPIALIAAIFLGNYVFQESFKNYYLSYNIHYIYSQWRPSIFGYTISLAVILYFAFSKLHFSHAAVKKISSLSFLVFFTHIIFLEIIWQHSQPTNDLIFFTLVTGASFSAAYLIHKIPHIYKLTG